jgi:hypothetical protein
VVEAVIAAIGEPPSASQTIAVALDFKGDVRGPVTWVFPHRIALELVRRLMCDPDPDPEAATDGATELANILTGRASASRVGRSARESGIAESTTARASRNAVFRTGRSRRGSVRQRPGGGFFALRRVPRLLNHRPRCD